MAKVVRSSKCRVVGWENAGSPGQRLVLAVLAQAFDNCESSVLCEAVLARLGGRGEAATNKARSS